MIPCTLGNFNQNGGGMKPFLRGILLVFSIFVHMAALEAAELHALLVGDLFSLDIQHASNIDLEKMLEEAKRIAKHGNFRLNAKILAGEKNLGSKLISVIKNLKVQKEDVILFYFSGHGYRTENNRDSPWPYLDFPAEHNGLCFKSLVDTVVKKRASLSILIADCCNWEVPYNYAPPILNGIKNDLVTQNNIKESYQKLFCDVKGVIAIVSAQPGQASYCSQHGSFYTMSFLVSLRAAIEGNFIARWPDIFEIADELLGEYLKVYNLNQNSFIYSKISKK